MLYSAPWATLRSSWRLCWPLMVSQLWSRFAIRSVCCTLEAFTHTRPLSATTNSQGNCSCRSFRRSLCGASSLGHRERQWLTNHMRGIKGAELRSPADGAALYLRTNPRETLKTSPPSPNTPIPLARPEPSMQASSGSMSLLATTR